LRPTRFASSATGHAGPSAASDFRPQRLVIQHGREWVGLGVIADNVVNIGHAIKKQATS
jgi:hypothetical protein